jgi:hypothetical protein
MIRFTNKAWLLSVVCLMQHGVTIAQSTQYNNNLGLERRGGRYSGSTSTTIYYKVDGFAPRPADDVLDRLKVKWGQPTKGPYPGTISLPGTLYAGSSNVDSEMPVNWFQGIRVLLARSTDTRPDWSRGHDDEQTVWSDVVVNADGHFAVTFDHSSFHRLVGRNAPYQVGICLAEPAADDPFTLTWHAGQPVLPATVSTIDIAGPLPLTPELQQINAATAWGRENYNPAMLVRAVNGLRAMGKQEAIDRLAEYLALAVDIRFHNGKVDATNIDTGDRDGVFWIIRLLFEPANADERLPTPYVYVETFDDDEPDAPLWPYCPLDLFADIPLFLHTGGGGTGLPEDPSSHLNWARDHGVLRSEPLRPADDPLAATDKWLALPKTRRFMEQRSWFGPDPNGLRMQAFRMVAHLLPDVQWALGENAALEEEQWQALRKEFDRRRIHWDAEAQSYTLRP